MNGVLEEVMWSKTLWEADDNPSWLDFDFFGGHMMAQFKSYAKEHGGEYRPQDITWTVDQINCTIMAEVLIHYPEGKPDVS